MVLRYARARIVGGCEVRNDLNAKIAKEMHAKNAKAHCEYNGGLGLEERNITFASIAWASFVFFAFNCEVLCTSNDVTVMHARINL